MATPSDAPPDAQPIDCALDVLPFFWMPKSTLQRRAVEDKIPYPDWEKAGYVITTPGSVIDHDAIFEYIVGTLAKKYTIRGIGIDQAGAAGLVSKLRRHYGEEFVDEIPQGFRSLSEPSKTVEALIMSQNVSHDGNPCMAMCVGNMAKEENTWREIRPVKIAQHKRIDGGVALLDAIAKMKKSPMTESSVYLQRGVRDLGDYLDA